MLRPADIEKLTGLNRAAARRYMLTLQALGYLGSDGDRFYLEPRVLDLGYAFINSMQIDQLVQPYLNKLANETHESSSFAVFDSNEVLFVARASSQKILQIAVGIGGRVPAYATSLGHALLSGLPPSELDRYFKSLPVSRGARGEINVRDLKASIEKTRKQGWVMVSNLLTNGIAAIAVPLRKLDGGVAGAINIASYGTGDAKPLKAHLELVLNTAAELERTLQSREPWGFARTPGPMRQPSQK